MKEKLYDKIKLEYGDKFSKEIIDGFSSRNVTLRVNTSKTNTDFIKAELTNLGINFREVSWYSDALIIDNVREDSIKKLSMYENGLIYLQSLSSMIPPLVLNPKEGESILDMAAAPGGKTTQMANLSNNNSLIMALEKNKIRSERLKYNIEKQGAKKVSVVVKDGRKLDEFFTFDKILLDAPCSGSGTLDLTDDSSFKVFSFELVNRSVKFQKELLESSVRHLKKGGEIVYSTCSILKEENEDILNYIVDKCNVEIVPIDMSLFTGVPLLPVTISGTMCVCPNELYEGFFVAKIRKY